MLQSNFERMIALAETVFASKQDPEQLDVDQAVIDRLHSIHAACVSEYEEGNGPIAWVLVIPTTHELMQLFLSKKISEKELFNQN